MGFFRTKDPKTGEPRLGAGVYLIICALMIGGAVLWNIRKDSNVGGLDQGLDNGPVITNPTDVVPVAEAASAHSEKAPVVVEENAPKAVASARGAEVSQEVKEEEAPVEEASNINTIQDTLDILRTNQDRVEKEKAEAVRKAQEEAEAQANAEILALKKSKGSFNSSSSSSTTADAIARKGQRRSAGFGATSTSEEGGGEGGGVLVVYDSTTDKASPAAIAAKAREAQIIEASQTASGFYREHFLPRGHQFPVYILSTVQTIGQEDIVEMAVAENVVFRNKIQIPYGTHLLGTAAASSFEDRVMINVDTILYPDGRELAISAFLKDAYDLSSGVKGYYIPQPMQVQMTPYVNEFIALWAEAAADRNSGNNNDSSSGTDFNTRSQAASSASDLIRTQAAKIQDRLDRRYPEKVVVPIGTRAYVKLRSALDLENAVIAGSALNNQPVLPGFENNPIRPSGVIERTANYGVANNAPLTSVPSRQPVAPPAASQETTLTPEMEAYMQSIDQLNKLSKQLDKPAKSKAPAASDVNWPQGDIE